MCFVIPSLKELVFHRGRCVLKEGRGTELTHDPNVAWSLQLIHHIQHNLAQGWHFKNSYDLTAHPLNNKLATPPSPELHRMPCSGGRPMTAPWAGWLVKEKLPLSTWGLLALQSIVLSPLCPWKLLLHKLCSKVKTYCQPIYLPAHACILFNAGWKTKTRDCSAAGFLWDFFHVHGWTECQTLESQIHLTDQLNCQQNSQLLATM